MSLLQYFCDTPTGGMPDGPKDPDGTGSNTELVARTELASRPVTKFRTTRKRTLVGRPWKNTTGIT